MNSNLWRNVKLLSYKPTGDRKDFGWANLDDWIDFDHMIGTWQSSDNSAIMLNYTIACLCWMSIRSESTSGKRLF